MSNIMLGGCSGGSVCVNLSPVCGLSERVKGRQRWRKGTRLTGLRKKKEGQGNQRTPELRPQQEAGVGTECGLQEKVGVEALENETAGGM